MPIWQLCANLLIPNCLRFNLSYSPLAALELYVNCCISFDSYIKPQPGGAKYVSKYGCISFDSYIKPQPHHPGLHSRQGCISFDSYIKPQRLVRPAKSQIRCISFDSYIKPQLTKITPRLQGVVYLLIPTSNHNYFISRKG